MSFDPLRIVLLFALVAAAGLGACVDAGSGEPEIDAELSRQLDADLAANVIVPTYEDFLDAATALVSATATYATSLAPADLDAARAAFEAAMAVWQRAEVMQVGPSGLSLSVAGGENIRDEIYSWPLLNGCRVDQEIVSGSYADVDAFAAQAANVRGLGAIEYLLYREDPTNTCAVTTDINANGTWDMVSDLAQRRADYAHTLAVLVERQAQRLVDAWAPTGGNFLAAMQAPETSGVFEDSQEAMNAITDAMFYVEFKTRDVKLPQPSGGAFVAESAWAHISLDEIRQNLIGFQELYLGGSPGGSENGFDDLLVTLGRADLATQMGGEIEGAIAAVDAVDPPPEDAATADAADVQSLFDEIQDLTDLLKNEFTAVLKVRRPVDITGDID